MLHWSCLKEWREALCSSYFSSPFLVRSSVCFCQVQWALLIILIANESGFTRWLCSFLSMSPGNLLTKRIISKQFHLDPLFLLPSCWANNQFGLGLLLKYFFSFINWDFTQVVFQKGMTKVQKMRVVDVPCCFAELSSLV